MEHEHARLQNRWLDTPRAGWTPALARELVEGLQQTGGSPAWLADAVLQTRCEDADAQLVLLHAGLAASEGLLAADSGCIRLRARAASARSLDDSHATGAVDYHDADDAGDVGIGQESLELVRDRRELLRLQDATKTWQLLYEETRKAVLATTKQQNKLDGTSPSSNDTEDVEDDVDASWAFDDEQSFDADEGGLGAKDTSVATSLPTSAADTAPSLGDFLDTPLIEATMRAAARADFRTLSTFLDRHAGALFPYRFAILDHIPLFADLSDCLDLLPQVDPSSGRESYKSGTPWRNSLDWTENASVTALVDAGNTPDIDVQKSLLSGEEVADWYRQKVQAIDGQTGRIDTAVMLAEYGASQHVPGMDALGEDLSLFSKLVYARASKSEGDALQQASAGQAATGWSLSRWQSSGPKDIVDAYLESSTAQSISDDLRRLVLPYLYVLESKLERQGSPDASLHERLLHDYILQGADTSRLELVAAIFEASKPTMPPGQRLIQSDAMLARLATATAYGFTGLSSWPTISKIFDCLPSLDQLQASTGPHQTLLSLFSSFPLGETPTPAAINERLAAFDLPSLSAALDAFDVHLEAAEIFARWSSPMPLRFFVTLSNDPKLQRTWADRLAKTSAAAVSHTTGRGGTDRLGADFEFEDEWISLLDDLCKLAGKDYYNEHEPRHAFASMSRREITRIFFSGLLSSGKFQLAKSLFSPSSGERPLDASTEQELVLAASREFYDNADSGNLHQGNMKLAFDCLSVAPPSPEIRKERDFIEATSRLASFRVLNETGQPLSPIEIRLTKDKLSLIPRLLQTSEDAYRHPEVVLDLVAKLGYRGDVLGEARVLSMLAESAMHANDSKRAADVCSRMIKAVEQIRKGRDKDKAAQAAGLAWRTCYEFGKHDGITDHVMKKELLGQALILCPPSNMSEILSVWLVSDSLVGQSTKVHSPTTRQSPSFPTKESLGLPFQIPSRSGTPSSISLPHSAESAARAALSVGRAASAYLPFRSNTPDPLASMRSPSPRVSEAGARRREGSETRSPARSADVVRDEISNKSRALVSWLIGADDHNAR